jgi:hypothetical protein
MDDHEDYDDVDAVPRSRVKRFRKGGDVRTDNGAFCMVPQIWLKFLKPSEALLLSYLCGRRKVYEKSGDLAIGGWFYSTIKSVNKALGFDKRHQARILKRLEIIGAIERKFAKGPSGKGREVRWIKVKRKQITQYAQAAESGEKPDFQWLKKQEKLRKNRLDRKFDENSGSSLSPITARNRKKERKARRSKWTA